MEIKKTSPTTTAKANNTRIAKAKRSTRRTDKHKLNTGIFGFVDGVSASYVLGYKLNHHLKQQDIYPL